MNSARSSRTAGLVALGRALADAGLSHIKNFHDPTARLFLDRTSSRALAKIEQAWREGKRPFWLAAARGLADSMALRTAAIDQALRDAIARGVRQVVILGAGYDGRAWRLPELAGVRVFEVDHPATQAVKRSHLTDLPPSAGLVSFVPIDFERESLDSVLGRAGHNRSASTCWIWEGVVMYLTPNAMRATLADISRRSAPGSTLIVHYRVVHRRLRERVLFRLMGEAQISAWTREEMAADLKAAGYVVDEDTGMSDWNDRFARSQANIGGAAYMRIATARR